MRSSWSVCLRGPQGHLVLFRSAAAFPSWKQHKKAPLYINKHASVMDLLGGCFYDPELVLFFLNCRLFFLFTKSTAWQFTLDGIEICTNDRSKNAKGYCWKTQKRAWVCVHTHSRTHAGLLQNLRLAAFVTWGWHMIVCVHSLCCRQNWWLFMCLSTYESSFVA